MGATNLSNSIVKRILLSKLHLRLIFPEAMMLFVSHASQDRSSLDGLLAVLRRTRQAVWLDDELGGGEAWWQTILEKIRECDVFIIALSKNSLVSKPCAAELQYAQALQRPILPVQIGPVDSVRVTPLAATQIIDYRNPSHDTEVRLISALKKRQAQCGPLPPSLPAEPEVPFAYLMRLATVLASPALSHYEQAGLVSELRAKLDEDCSDTAAQRDIVRLLYLLRDRPDVTWRTRSEVDALLGACDTALSTPVGLATVPFARPQSVEVAADRSSVEGVPPTLVSAVEGSPSSLQAVVVPPLSSSLHGPEESPAARARPVVVVASDSPAAHPWRTRFRRGRWLLAAAAGVAVVATVGAAVLHSQAESQSIDVALLEDDTLNTIMGVDGMKTAESGIHKAKHTRGTIEVSPPECASVLYPGLDRSYRDSGGGRVTWRVSEDRGGMARAGIDENSFVDQDVAVFPEETDRAAAFIRASAIPWKACAGQTVSVTYRGTDTYTWKVGDVVGETPKISQSFTLADGKGYTCQRVLGVVTNVVLDIKACGQHVDDEANKIAGRLAAAVTDAAPF
ncbi:sensor domain-containing protein [Mycobacterium sp. UM_WGJ]|uniref:sensor domain-containing protein n=1 Tax=Mycobacterium sp. UM_WGJ TaxID=1370120 RepID=UPI0018CA3B91|nr:sensor domain-containing protein [Mycobacterium sp. UM_WGJ]